MAVRWGPGEESFSTCNMDIFPLETLDETHGLCSEHTLGTFQDCLDPTILSIFEDTPATKTRDLEEETEATLLTALTEILDNVDDENLSPFDMLPESDLLSGQKGREQSPLRRIFGLSRSPPGKIRSTGKTLPMVQQRSDGEEDEDCLTQSPESLDLSSDNELLDWDGLPITLGEQHDEDGLSVNLGDLVKHMHPYCMSFSLEDDKGNQMLPEGGILLEVVDQGENGEPILAIPEMVHPVSVKLDELLSDSKGLEKTDDQASDTSEHIVVDDDDDVDVNIKLPVRDDGKITSSDVRSQITKDDNKGDLKGNNNSRQKNKSNLVVASTPQPTGGRVLRSASLKKASRKQPKKYRNEGGQKDSKAPQDLNTMSTIEPKNTTISQTEICTVSLLPVFSKQAEEDQSETPPKAECFQQPDPILNIVAPASANEESAIATSTDDPCASVNEDASPKLTHATDCTGELPSSLLPPAVMVEPKPKALSLAEYRRLRQQKKPAPIEKLDNNSTKWPSLPEMPKELPPLPHLPEPSPRDPRRSKLQSKEPEEVKPAWMPRGPGAPPTPEALLAPPAYMVNSTVKASTTAVPTKQQTVSQTVPFQPSNCENISAAAPHTQETTKREGYSATDSPETVSADALKPAANVLTCKPSNAAVSPEIKPSIKSSEELPKSTDSCGQKFSSSVSQSPEKSEKPPVKNPTEELIEAFTSEMGIEATDLTSLLEQFEETQAKEEQCVPEVCGRAVAVGNSSSDLNSERNYVERVRANDLSSTALTPPGTPPHPTWKPLVPVALLGKSKTEEIKSGLSKIIEIEAQPLPSVKARSKYTPAAVTPDMACQDHDYCLPNKGTSSGEAGKRWNVKQNSSIFIKPIKQSITPAQQNVQTIIVKSVPCAPKTQLDLQTDCLKSSSVFETPDASPTRDAESNNFKQAPVGQSNCQSASSPTPSLKQRSEGRSRVRRSRRSPSSRSNSESDSSRSRSRSYTPPTKRYRLHRSRSSSFSRSRSRSSSASESPSRSPRCRRYSYFSSRSASWSRSRSRSRSCSRSRSRSRSKSPQWSRKRQWCRDSYGTNVKTNHELKIQKEKAIEERRVVYVGRIRGTMTQKELKERFSYFGKIEECTLHFRDHGDHYGFVTYYNTNDAFMAIENGSKLRKPDEYPFDLCFGGRRQFCQTSYADLDSSKEYDPLPSRSKTLALDFDTLLKQAQQNMKR